MTGEPGTRREQVKLLLDFMGIEADDETFDAIVAEVQRIAEKRTK